MIADAVQQQLLFPIAELDPVSWLLTGIVVALARPDAQGADDLEVRATALRLLSPRAAITGIDVDRLAASSA